jgi:hypothetical protein
MYEALAAALAHLTPLDQAKQTPCRSSLACACASRTSHFAYIKSKIFNIVWNSNAA